MIRTWALVRNQLRMFLADPTFIISNLVVAVAIQPILEQWSNRSLLSSGFSGTSGAEHVIPGQAILFGFFVASSASYAVFREHEWNTWDRLRSAQVSPARILSGVAAPWIAVVTAFQCCVFVGGFLVLGYRPGLSLIAPILTTSAAFGLFAVSFYLLVSAVARTWQQVQAAMNIGGILFAGLGGALVPVEELPSWISVAAPATPLYWAVSAHRETLIGEGLSTGFWPGIGLLTVMSLGLLAICAWLFDTRESELALS